MNAGNFSMQINCHYGRLGLAEAIRNGMQQAGLEMDRISYDELSPFDQFHARGIEATRELAGLAKLESGMRVLDIGGGLGGAARLLAAEHGCHVTVLDTTEEFCNLGEWLTHTANLENRVNFRQGNALDIPYEDESFDVVWLQHCGMNIENKERLYAEIFRVLHPGGLLALHEIAAGKNQPVHFPVPWASRPELSFLSTPSELGALIERRGFVRIADADHTGITLEWIRDKMASAPESLPPIGVHLLLGEQFKPAFTNVLRNLEEQRVEVIQAVYRK